jgi:hypothetical protein
MSDRNLTPEAEIRRLRKIINSIYWGVQDESDTQAVAVFIEQEAPECVDLEEENGEKRDREETADGAD